MADNIPYDPKLVNLTPHEIVIYDTANTIIVRLPSRGELRILTRDGPYYPLHPLHYYDAETNVEAGIPISSARQCIKLDESSPGYALLNELNNDADWIIVSLPVAQYILSNGQWKECR